MQGDLVQQGAEQDGPGAVQGRVQGMDLQDYIQRISARWVAGWGRLGLKTTKNKRRFFSENHAQFAAQIKEALQTYC